MRKIRVVGLLLFLCILCGCVDQSIGDKYGSEEKSSTIRATPIKEPRIVATSMATVQIFEKLDLDLVAVPESKRDKVPQRYKSLPKIGLAMNPDLEKIKSLKPDYVFSPVSLAPDLVPKYESAGLEYGFLNLNNLDGMYKSIEDLGVMFGREERARELHQEYKNIKEKYRQKAKDKKPVKVLILMGLPGSYVVATDKSYVGSLVNLMGGENVYSDKERDFLSVNTEDMLDKKPDVILRTAHAMPQDVMEMFKKEFETNEIWQHFKAVQEGRVYNLSHENFGMSASFAYPKALEELEGVLYGP